MKPFKIGTLTESFRLPLYEGIQKAKSLGVDGVQLHAGVGGTISAEMNAVERKKLRAFCNDLNLEISAVCGDLGGHGLERDKDNSSKIEKLKQIVDLTVDLETQVEQLLKRKL